MYYFTFPDGVVEEVSIFPPQMSVQITGLLAFTTYGFYVSATNYIGEGATSVTSTGLTDEAGKIIVSL